MGKGTNTTTQTTAPNPQAMAAYQSLLAQAQNVAATPYQAYSGQLVAPVNQQQQTGVGNINTNANFASPYIQQAAGYATNAAQPITGQQIQQYESPYTSQVVNATEQQFNNQNAQQQQQVLGNAAAQGALGGDRTAVAQSVLAGQQQAQEAPVIAGLENTGYSQALQEANVQQQNQANAAYSLGNLGVSGQNAALSGATAQLGAGTLEQQTQQAQDTAAYQQFEQQLAYPFQTEQWLAGIDTGVGSQLGGTSTTTGPPPNTAAQYAGLGIAGVGALGQLGGSGGLGALLALSDRRAKENIKKIGKLFDGQSIYRFNYKGDRETRVGLIAQEVEKRHPEAVYSGHGLKEVDYDAATKDAIRRALGGMVPGFDQGGAASPYGASNPVAGMPYSGVSGYVPSNTITRGQGAPRAPQAPQQTSALQMFQNASAMARGFSNNNRSPATGVQPIGTAPEAWSPGGGDTSANAIYRDGGVVGRAYGGLALPQHGRIQLRRGGPAIPVRLGLGMSSFMPHRAMGGFADGGVPGDDSDSPFVGSTTLAPLDTASDDTQDGVGTPLAYVNDGVGVSSPQAPMSLAGAPAASMQAPGMASPNGGLSSDAYSAMMAAGLGMMASRSPFLGVALGEGGLQGLQTYSDLQKVHAAAQKQQQDIDLKVKQLAQQADIEQKKLAQQSSQFGQTKDIQRAELGLKQQHENVEAGKPVITAEDAYGNKVYSIRDPHTGQLIPILKQAPPVAPRPSSSAAPVAPAMTWNGATTVPEPGASWPVTRAAGGGVDDAAPGAAISVPSDAAVQSAPTEPLPVQVAQVAPMPAPPVGAMPAQIDHSLVGDDYLKQFPPEIQAGVKNYIAGMSMPTGNPRQGFTSQVKMIAQKYGQDIGEPADDTTFSARKRYRDGLSQTSPSSPGGQKILFNTAMEHLKVLADHAEALQNSGGMGIAPLASAINAVRAQGTGQDALINGLNNTAQLFSGEVGKLYSGSTGGGEREREATASRFGGTKTPAALAEGLGTSLELMHGKLMQMEQQRNDVLGRTGGNISFITPQTQATINRVQGSVHRLNGDTAPTRFQQLTSSGMPKAAAYAQMHAEGY